MLEFYDADFNKLDELSLPATIQGQTSRIDFFMKNITMRGMPLVYKIKDKRVQVLEAPRLIFPNQTDVIKLLFVPGTNKTKDVDDFLEIREA